MSTESKTKIYRFKAFYDRTGTIFIGEHKCHICNIKKDVLCIDSSENEYGPGCVCKDCIDNLFVEEERRQEILFRKFANTNNVTIARERHKVERFKLL